MVVVAGGGDDDVVMDVAEQGRHGLRCAVAVAVRYGGLSAAEVHAAVAEGLSLVTRMAAADAADQARPAGQLAAVSFLPRRS
jgi:hypothetical protein